MLVHVFLSICLYIVSDDENKDDRSINIAANILWYQYKVYPTCANVNLVSQKMYRIEVILIQKVSDWSQ